MKNISIENGNIVFSSLLLNDELVIPLETLANSACYDESCAIWRTSTEPPSRIQIVKFIDCVTIAVYKQEKKYAHYTLRIANDHLMSFEPLWSALRSTLQPEVRTDIIKKLLTDGSHNILFDRILLLEETGEEKKDNTKASH